jgi:serine/threonine-protein kinase RsbW
VPACHRDRFDPRLPAPSLDRPLSNELAMLPMTREPNVRLVVTNLPENVFLVREILAGLASVVPLADGQLDDVKTVVSEACNNVVLHAYDGARGPLDVEIRVEDDRLEVSVTDTGGGLRPRPKMTDQIDGIGIPVILALSDRVEFTGGIDQGTQVRMQFDVPGARQLASPPGTDAPPSAATSPDRDRADPQINADTSAGDTRVTLVVEPLSLAGSMLSRPLTALAARARFSIDRLSDLQLVTDAIAAHAGRSLSGNRLQVGVILATRSLQLRIGPLRPGTASQLIDDTAVGGLAPLIQTLADELTVETCGEAEVLTLRMLDPR